MNTQKTTTAATIKLTLEDYRGKILTRDDDTARIQFPTMAQAVSWAGDYLPEGDDTQIEPVTSLRSPVVLLVRVTAFLKAFEA